MHPAHLIPLRLDRDRLWRSGIGPVLTALALCACVEGAYIADPSDAGGSRPVADGGVQDLLARDQRPLPDTAAPDTAAPDTAAPDTAAPDTAAPDTAAPDTWEPDTARPDAWEPDTAAPDTAAPDTAAPDTAVPDSAVPDRTAADTAAPDAWEPDAWEPDAWEPDAWRSDAAAAIVVELPPVADAWLRQGSPDAPGGDSVDLAIGFCTAGSNQNMKVWLKFDLRALPDGAVVENAEVKLHFHSHWNSQNYPAYLSDDDSWDEQGITWNDHPAYGPEVLDTVEAFTVNDVWRSWDVTAAAVQELAGNGKITLVLEGEELIIPTNETDDAENWAYSKEHEDPSLAPRLVVRYR